MGLIPYCVTVPNPLAGVADHPVVMALGVAGVRLCVSVWVGVRRGPRVQLQVLGRGRILAEGVGSSWAVAVAGVAMRADVLGLLTWGEVSVATTAGSVDGLTLHAWARARLDLHEHARLATARAQGSDRTHTPEGPHDPQDPTPATGGESGEGCYPPPVRDTESGAGGKKACGSVGKCEKCANFEKCSAKSEGCVSKASADLLERAKRVRNSAGMILQAGERASVRILEGGEWNADRRSARTRALEKTYRKGRKKLSGARPTTDGEMLCLEMERVKILGAERARAGDCAYAECMMCGKAVAVTSLTCGSRCRKRLERWRARKGLKAGFSLGGGWNRTHGRQR